MSAGRIAESDRGKGEERVEGGVVLNYYNFNERENSIHTKNPHNDVTYTKITYDHKARTTSMKGTWNTY